MVINSTLIFGFIPELKDALSGLRIAKVLISSDQKELLFFLRGRDKKINLYFSAHSENSRMEIWEEDEKEENWKDYQKTNLFWFAAGGYVRGIEQLGFDRVIKISCEKKTQFGAGETFELVFELTGRNSNLVLVKPDRLIVDCLRKIDSSRSRFRQILPGGRYLPPPPAKKRNPFFIKKGEFVKLVRSSDEPALEWLISTFVGLDELLSQKIVTQTGLDLKKKTSELSEDGVELLWKRFSQTFKRIVDFDLTFQIVVDADGDPKAISCLDLSSVPNDQKISCQSLNSAVKRFFSLKLRREKQKREVHRLSRVVQRARRKLKRRAKKIEDDLRQAERFEQYRRFGELLMMNKETVKKGQTSVRLPDVFASADSAVEIPLDPKLSPIRNAQSYFKKHRKAKDALSTIEKRRLETGDQIACLEKISGQLERFDEKVDSKGIRRSLIRLKFLPADQVGRAPRSPARGKKERVPSFRTFLTGSGTQILVGRNNKENDYLTFRFARPDDLWFHAQDVPGSHVLLKRVDKKTEPSPEQIREAAKVAAYFSKARGERKAAVTYTSAKYVRKPKKGKPGLALVEREKTILVRPGLPEQE